MIAFVIVTRRDCTRPRLRVRPHNMESELQFCQVL
jgi:hypothetical protein